MIVMIIQPYRPPENQTPEERIRELMIEAVRDLYKSCALDGIFSVHRSPAEIIDSIRPIWLELLKASEEAQAEAVRRIIAACGCGTVDGCERCGECGGRSKDCYCPAPQNAGCRRFVRAVRGEAL